MPSQQPTTFITTKSTKLLVTGGSRRMILVLFLTESESRWMSEMDFSLEKVHFSLKSISDDEDEGFNFLPWRMWALTKLGLEIRESQGLETDLNRSRDFTGSRESISNITSFGKLQGGGDNGTAKKISPEEISSVPLRP